jgi:hypothetical protein
MIPTSEKNGIRNLAHVYEGGTSSRVLNLMKIHSEKSHLSAYRERPLFQSAIFTKCMLLKHHLRQDEKAFFNENRSVATKIIWPFDQKSLRCGGYNLFVGERDYVQKLGQLVGGRLRFGNADIAVLEAIDHLPTLDPFILQGYLNKVGFRPAPCYFDINADEQRQLTAYVADELKPLVNLSMGTEYSEHSVRTALASKLMALRSDPIMEPIRYALNLSSEEFENGLFSWKGFLYYKWVRDEFLEPIKNTIRQINVQKSYGTKTHGGREEINNLRKIINSNISKTIIDINETLEMYNRSFGNLVFDNNPMIFRQFLIEAPKYFDQLGHQIAAITYIVEFWSYRMRGYPNATISEEELIDLLDAFCRCLDCAAPRVH